MPTISRLTPARSYVPVPPLAHGGSGGPPPLGRGDDIVRSSRDSNNPDHALTQLAKNAIVGSAAHRLVPHRYEFRAIETKIDPITGRPRNTSTAGVFDTQANVSARTGRARGSFEVRFDRPHAYRGATLGSHINLGVGEHRSVDLPHLLVEGARPLAGAFRVLDRVAVPVGIALDSTSIGEAYVADGNRIGRATGHAAASALGGWAGAAAFAPAFAEGGAAIGMLGGPPGAAIGGIVGGIVGGLAGSFGGSALGERIAGEVAR